MAADYSFTILANVPGTSSSILAEGINDTGQIVGQYFNGGVRGFRLSGGIFTLIDVPGARFTVPYGINKAGQIVGGFGPGDGDHNVASFLRTLRRVGP